MRASIFAPFFIVISTAWGLPGISKRESQLNPPPPPYSVSNHRQHLIYLPPNSDVSEADLPPEAALKDMEEAWKNRGEKLMGNFLKTNSIYKMKKDPRSETQTMMRKRKLTRPGSYEATFREIVYLGKLHRLVAWSMEDPRSFVRPNVYIAMLDSGYVSGDSTKLPKPALKALRQGAERSYMQQDNMEKAGSDPSNYLYRFEGGKCIAEYI